jgi:cyclohexyl-isocyanide hydratase
MTLQIGFALFDRVTLLDLVGPHQVFAAIASARIHLVSETLAPVMADSGITLLPTTTYADCPRLDIVCVPGGAGVNALLSHLPTLDFLRRQARTARYVTSVCTGALVLGAAGLLEGKRATTHWAVHDLLAAYGAQPVNQRVVADGNLFTGGGVTAGIDFALALTADLLGPAEAQSIQLRLEYAPQPPFNAGRPEDAPPEVLERVRSRGAKLRADRVSLAEKYRSGETVR